LLELFGRARVLVHPMRVEGRSRIACEARAMGAVPVALSSHRFGVGLDAAGGALTVDAVDEMPGAVADLLGAPDRLGQLSAAGMRSARDEVGWSAFVERVDAALGEPAGDAVARSAPAGVGDALRERDCAHGRELDRVVAERDAALGELERHRRWLASTTASFSWRATAPLRAAKRSLARAGARGPAGP
jgi:hypothetical protein